MRALRVVGLIFLCSCGRVSGSGINALVEYHLIDSAGACVKVRASPQTPAGLTKENSYSLQGKPKDGSVKFGILVTADWKGDVTVRASLHRPCASALELASAVTVEKVPATGSVVTRNLVLTEAGPDGGTPDGGEPDAGGTDAGEVDAGTQDAGSDAGSDAGGDAGLDAGAYDAGPYDAGRSCDGGVAYFLGPPNMTNTPWNDIALYPNGGVWLIGTGALHRISPQGTWLAAPSSCDGNHKAGWARPSDGRVYFGTVGAGLKFIDPTGVACTTLMTSPDAGEVLGIAGFVDGGTTSLYSVTLSGVILRQTDPPDFLVNNRWDLAASGVKELWTVSGTSESTLFAGGKDQANKGVVFKFDPATDSWVKQTINAGNTVNDISVANASLAFAVTEDADLWQWDGGVWTKPNNNFGNPVYGVQAFSATEAYAVGAGATVRRWNGMAWLTLGIFDAGTPNPALNRIRGLSSCDLWSAGTNGSVIRSP